MDLLRFVKDKVDFELEIKQARAELRLWVCVFAFFLVYFSYQTVSYATWHHNYQLRLVENKNEAVSRAYEWEHFCQDGVTAQENAFVVDCRMAQAWRLMDLTAKSAKEAHTPWLWDSRPDTNHKDAFMALVVIATLWFYLAYLCVYKMAWAKLRRLIDTRNMSVTRTISVHKATLRERTSLRNVLRDELKTLQADMAECDSLLLSENNSSYACSVGANGVEVASCLTTIVAASIILAIAPGATATNAL